MYLKTLEGKSVYCSYWFTPYFFLKLPEDWNKKKAKAVENEELVKKVIE